MKIKPAVVSCFLLGTWCTAGMGQDISVPTSPPASWMRPANISAPYAGFLFLQSIALKDRQQPGSGTDELTTQVGLDSERASRFVGAARFVISEADQQALRISREMCQRKDNLLTVESVAQALAKVDHDVREMQERSASALIDSFGVEERTKLDAWISGAFLRSMSVTEVDHLQWMRMTSQDPTSLVNKHCSLLVRM